MNFSMSLVTHASIDSGRRTSLPARAGNAFIISWRKRDDLDIGIYVLALLVGCGLRWIPAGGLMQCGCTLGKAAENTGEAPAVQRVAAGDWQE